MRATEFIVETAMMGKIADSGKIIRILKKAHTVPFSDEKNWLLVDTDPGKGNSGLGIKWIPADTRFEWVRPYRDTVEQDVAEGSEWETRHNEFVTVGNRATLEQINKIVKALVGAAQQAGSKRGFLNQLVGKQSNGDLARMAHGAETLVKNIQKNSNAKPGSDERKELGQQLVYAVSLLKRISGEQGVAEGQDDKAEAYRAHLIKTLPQIMKLFANIGKGWIPSKEQMLSAVDTAYIVMKHTGDVKQAGKVLMDELNTLYRMSQGKQGVAENFADGKKPGRKGLAKRMGVDCKQSVSKLRGIAANSSGERQRMAHWCANMKSGGKK